MVRLAMSSIKEQHTVFFDESLGAWVFFCFGLVFLGVCVL